MPTLQPTRTTVALLYFAHNLARAAGWLGIAFLAAVGVALIPALLDGASDQDLTIRLSLDIAAKVRQHGLLLFGTVAGAWLFRFTTARLIRDAEAILDAQEARS